MQHMLCTRCNLQKNHAYPQIKVRLEQRIWPFRFCDHHVTSLLLVRMSPNTVCVRACALVLAVVTCPFVITAYSREHE